ncbi:Uncharacterised protein [Mycobacterium tuberculosis]|nr:Uncharacterised protein [Mycobacterium tuberculosis]CKT47112.1 Uncharacterised protein [Mycobacterium tuberculosis]CKU99938.1 Uncharacterised protein [Mycobacterium tuberculosis]
MITVFDGTGGDTLQVTTGSGLGHRDRGDQFPGAEVGKPAPLLLFGGQRQQVRRHDVVVQAKTDPAVPSGAGFLGDDRVVPEVRVTPTAILLGHRHAQKSLLAGLQPHAAVDDLGLFPFIVIGRDVAIEERPVRLAKQLMFGFEKCALVLGGTAHGCPPGKKILVPNNTNRAVGRQVAGARQPPRA